MVSIPYKHGREEMKLSAAVRDLALPQTTEQNPQIKRPSTKDTRIGGKLFVDLNRPKMRIDG
jgi:hypothetical protein